MAHGDFRFGNCMTDVQSGRIAAILDWELCTLGDPLADVGYLSVYWTDQGSEPRRAQRPVRRDRVPDLPGSARAVRAPDRP